MRIGLRDDFGSARCAPEATSFSIPVALDGDPGGGCGCSTVETPGDVVPPDDGLLVLSIRTRSRTMYDGDGTPRWEWLEVASGGAIVFETRRELNDATGQTLVLATATIGWDDAVEPPKETAVAWDSLNRRWEIKVANRRPGRLELEMEYLDDAE